MEQAFLVATNKIKKIHNHSAENRNQSQNGQLRETREMEGIYKQKEKQNYILK